LNKPEDLFVSRIMTDLWVNFAETGHPTPDLSLGFKWDPVVAGKVAHLAISSSPAMAQPSYMTRVNEFWKNMPTLVNKLLYPESFKKMYN